MIKKMIKRILYGNKCDQETYLKFLKSKGAVIGEDVNLFALRSCHIDSLNCHLLSIGSHVNIVASTILTHDYAWSVIKRKTGEILGNQKPVHIGNNVFIGHGSIILGGGYIEDNVIIGANSVISGLCEKDSVYAGNPARKIMSLNSYMEKRRSCQFEEARTFVKMWISTYRCLPSEENMHEYFYLFTNNTDDLNNVLNDKLKLCCNYDESMNYINHHKAMFDTYQDFLDACIAKKKTNKIGNSDFIDI